MRRARASRQRSAASHPQTAHAAGACSRHSYSKLTFTIMSIYAPWTRSSRRREPSLSGFTHHAYRRPSPEGYPLDGALRRVLVRLSEGHRRHDAAMLAVQPVAPQLDLQAAEISTVSPPARWRLATVARKHTLAHLERRVAEANRLLAMELPAAERLRVASHVPPRGFLRVTSVP